MVRFATLVAVLSSAGCHAFLGIDDFTTADASIDVPIPDTSLPDAQLCYGSLSRVCLAAPPSLGTIIIAGTLDTSSDPRCDVHQQPGGPDLCVIAGGIISIEDTIASGTRPVVFIGTGSVTVNGTITVSSPRAGVLGAGASSPPCVASQNGTSANDGGGGAGGSFGTPGGAGGRGANIGGAGGTVAPIMNPTVIRAGCAGGAGVPGGSGSGGAGGKPGGAIALLSGSQISIVAAGAIHASGGGGAGTANRGGGGGGGSGGLIVLDAPSIQVLGKVVAHGAGGGGTGAAQTGDPGGDGATTMAAVAGVGGDFESSSHGATGGHGTSSVDAAEVGATPSVTSNGGGGGGGGGAGIVWVHGTLAGGLGITPAPQMH